MKYLTLKLVLLLLTCNLVSADVTLPNLFSDHMVLQRDQVDPIWGKADPGEKVTVSFNGQSKETEADADGDWRVELEPMAAGGPFEMVIQGNNEVVLKDILIGEVWVCSGQSNMQWIVNNTNNKEVEVLSANYPEIRLLSLPRVGTQEPQDNIDATWEVCSPETVGNFSAVGYFFGRRIHQTLDVPVGLIHNAWGGSSAEAWVPRELLEQDEQFASYIANHDQKAAEYTDEIHQEKIAEYQEELARYKANGESGRHPRWPSDPRYNQHRPGNIYNGGVLPLVGYGIRGMIWYQGESNSGRYETYEDLINLMVGNFREQWDQGDFPFYYVQLADFSNEQDAPSEGGWPLIREAQTKTMDSLENSGMAVIIDIGEGRDIHPRNKQDVANRLARWALANDYGYDIAYRSPQYASMEVVELEQPEVEDADSETDPSDSVAPVKPKAIEVTFDHISQGLYSFDTQEVVGFAIAGEDKQFVWADAEIIGKDKVRVWSESVAEPVAVRYGWAMNPVVNLQDRNGLPVTPFRTDEW
ncbi:sialate O-acetylesterase [Cerasicoccus frondis]|uniref:sialate O-acetylesterase n=1 Tax=Cerasicoccus frondis TaxID=490090 RepID=UPI0028528D87|nr:sialate O-acetylesterase [Cerasicoccus frondis]